MICGGVGAARFLRGLVQVVDPAGISAIVNVGDDTVLHGLDISPDLDTITYTLAGAIDPERGWGLVDETWQAMEQVRRYASANGISGNDPSGNDAAGWFSLGDRDLGTHLYRTQRLDEGATLADVTAEIATAWGLELAIVPMTNDPVRTRVTVESGETIDFQRYFVERQHRDRVTSVQFVGADRATASPGVIDALRSTDCIDDRDQ